MESLNQAIEDARARYVSANPLSLAADKSAEEYLPGGNTRSVLHFEPFPLTMTKGEGAELVDLDGHRYVFTKPWIRALPWVRRPLMKGSWRACCASVFLMLIR